MESFPDKIPGKIRFTLNKEERLCSKKQMEKLFSEGLSFLVYPLKVVYTEVEFPGTYPAKAAFAVSKRLFKKTVHRNLIKRRMREAYRLNKQLLYSGEPTSKKAIVFIYIGKKIPDFHSIENAMKKSLTSLSKKITPNP